MLRMVLDDYRYNFLSALKEFGKVENGWWMYAYMLIFPVMFLNGTGKEIIVYYGTMLPLLGGALFARLYPNHMSRTLFLCPMSRKMRIEYFKFAFFLRVAIPTLAFFLLDGIILLLKIIQGLEFFLSLVVLLMYLISVNVCANSWNGKPEMAGQRYVLPGYFPMWSVLGQISGIMNMIIGVGLRGNNGEPYTLGELILAGVLLVIQALILVKIVLSYLKPVMERSVSYEACYVSLKK